MADLFSEDFLDFIGLLNRHQVDYVVVGGFAVNIHGYQRSTGDVDIWVRKTQHNYERLVNVFHDFRLPLFDMTLSNFLSDRFDVFSFGRPPQALDLITSLKGMDFDEVFTQSIVYEERSETIRVIHKNHLIEAKKHAGRWKDHDDIQGLLSEA
ncbi:MAG: hypothetical protein MUF62_08465 [Chitinophagaceae bacterium]|jgi:hypothetical protein|nr:hypothetical protein [Chitinophagaceae bacterium]